MVLHTHAIRGTRGMTLLEIIVALSVLTILLVALGASLGTLGKQSEMNRQLAAVDAEVGNSLSLLHTAPFDTIAQDLVQNGFISVGGFVYRKDLSGAPNNLPNGRISVALLGVASAAAGGNPVLPDPLTMNVTVSWDMVMAANTSRTFATVRTR